MEEQVILRAMDPAWDSARRGSKRPESKGEPGRGGCGPGEKRATCSARLGSARQRERLPKARPWPRRCEEALDGKHATCVTHSRSLNTEW